MQIPHWITLFNFCYLDILALSIWMEKQKNHLPNFGKPPPDEISNTRSFGKNVIFDLTTVFSFKPEKYKFESMFVLGNGKSTGKIVTSVSSNGVIISTAHYPVDECGRRMHYHENPHICFLLQGGDIESRDNLSYERKTGDVYFYYAGEKHASISRKSLSKNRLIRFTLRNNALNNVR